MHIASWIWADNLRPFLEVLGEISGYDFDESDWSAVEAGVRGTDGERGVWYSYSFGATTGWVVAVAQDPGTAVIQVRLSCPDAVSEHRARVDLLLQIASTYRMSKS